MDFSESFVFLRIKNYRKYLILNEIIGGRGEIRTHGGLAPTTVFKTVALNRSATLPSVLHGITFGFNRYDFSESRIIAKN